MAGGLLVALVYLFYRWFDTQHRLSASAMEDWGHAYLIPLISGFLVYKRQALLAQVRVRPFWPALPVMLVGIFAYFMGIVGFRNHMIQGFSLVLTVAGVVLLMTGPRAFQLLFLPVVFLLFAVTVSEAIMIRLTFPLQLIATQGGYLLLNLVGFFAGFSCDAAGNTLQVIDSRGRAVPLNVAEACSGMRMVVAFIALGGATALLACREWWQRILLLLLATPVAIIVNVFRVAILGLLSLEDPDLAAGEAHTLIGTVLLVPGLGLFLGVVWALNRVMKPDAAGRAVA